MAEYRGVLSGIGDMSAGINVIEPYHDAALRNFIVGKDAILDGLNLMGDSLDAGAVQCQGFVGTLPLPIMEEGLSNTDIYAVFIVYNSPNVLDEFYIVVGNPEDPDIDITKRDTLSPLDKMYPVGTKRTYALLLYSAGKRQVDNNYPEHAKYASDGDNLTGTISPDAIVTGAIKDGDVNDKTVASTEWVQKVIREQIGYEMIEVNYYAHYSPSTSIADKQVGVIRLEKKANYIIAISERTNTDEYDIVPDTSAGMGGGTTNGGWLYIDPIPEDFRGDNMIVMLHCKTLLSGVSSYGDAWFALKVSKDTGLVANSSSSGSYNRGNVSTLLGEVSTSGWKINL